MARVRDIQLEEMQGEARETFVRFVEDYGPFLNQVHVFAHRPPILRHVMGLLLELKQEAVLPARDLEIALVTVSEINRCTYCVGHHAPRLVELGLPTLTADVILEADVPGFSDRDRLVRDFAVAVSNQPGRIPEALFDRLRSIYDEGQIVELTCRIALCGFFNRVVEALAIEPEVEELLDDTPVAAESTT